MSVIESIETKVYAVRIKNKDSLLKSSSGGAFSAISDVFLANGDAVVCATYNYVSHFVEYQLILDKEGRDAARGSKYVQSIPGDSFKIAYDWLINHPEKRLLYIGMGCQVDGFRKYAESVGIRDRVWLVDIICHGSPSPEVWKKYVYYIGGADEITDVNFRSKRKKNGWKHPTSYIVIKNREYKVKDYMQVFYNGYALRPSCYVCPYATTKRKVDITIGDFWHIEDKLPNFYDADGNSVFLIHTNRGIELFKDLETEIDFEESNVIDCWQKNLEKPTEKPDLRERFWKDYKMFGIKYVMKNYGQPPFIKRVYNRIRKIIKIVKN